MELKEFNQLFVFCLSMVWGMGLVHQIGFEAPTVEQQAAAGYAPILGDPHFDGFAEALSVPTMLVQVVDGDGECVGVIRSDDSFARGCNSNAHGLPKITRDQLPGQGDK